MVEPLNYAALLGTDNFVSPLDRELQRTLTQTQNQQAQVQTQALQQRMQAEQAAQERQKAYETSLQGVLASGDQRELSRLLARFPENKDALKASWDQMDALEQRSNLR